MADTAPSRPVAGILWMLLTGLLFVGFTAVAKHAGGRIPAAEAGFLRYLLGLPLLLPMLAPIFRAHLTPRQVALFGARGALHTAGVILWFYAMTRIPLAEVTALNYLNPIYVTIGAALFLGERLAARRLVAVAAAFLGALVILRPGLREVEPGHLAMLGTAASFAGGYLIAKQLSGEVSAAVIVGMLSLTVTIGLAPFALMNWVTPTLTELAWYFLAAILATGGHFTMTLAFAAAPVTVTQPVTFLQLVWATILGAAAFGEAIDIGVVAGASLIMAAVSFITWREHRLKRGPAPDAPVARA